MIEDPHHPEPQWHGRVTAVDARLGELHDEFETILAALVSLPAISAENRNLAEAAEQLASVMRECGLSASLHPTAGAPIVLGRFEQSAELPTLLIYGHYDVQPVEPVASWASDPFTLTHADGRMFGRGTADNKAQHLAQLMAVKAMLDVHGGLPLNLIMIVEGQEEVGSPHLASWLDANRDLLRADFAYTSDGSIHPSGRPVIVCGARGLLYLDISLTVARSDRHSGNFGGVARNAAQELSAALTTLWDAEGNIAVPGFHDDVAPTAEATHQAISALPLEADNLHSEGIRSSVRSSTDWFDRVLLRPTLNLAGLESGWTGPSMKTIIPAVARAKLDARLVPNQSPRRVAELIEDHLRSHCPQIEVSLVAAMETSRTPVSLAYVESVREAVAFGWGEVPFVYPNLAGSLPDYVFTKVLGIPSVIVPYGNADQANHAPNENMSVANFHKGARTFVSVLHALGDPAQPAQPSQP